MCSVCFFQLLFFSFAQAVENLGTSEAKINSEPQQQSGIDGFSVGLTAAQLNFDYNIKRTTSGTAINTGYVDDVRQAQGVVLSYSRIPLSGFGFDFNLGYLRHSNPAAASDDLVQWRSEANMMGSLRISHSFALYGLLGGNMEVLNGSSANGTMQPFGLGAQAGLGMAVFSSFHFTVEYVATAHKLSGAYRAALESSGSSVDDNGSFVLNRGYVGRLSYNF